MISFKCIQRGAVYLKRAKLQMPNLSKMSNNMQDLVDSVFAPGLHNMADHRTIGPRKFFRLAEKIEDKTVRV